ncbi:zinc-finger-containing protein [Paraburkholderia aspalathi]|uniref:zinc-finger-containing protein n=1 Tax=Paraburkholderia aspalathi TaxID=1324617 RepID=UPI0038B7ED42
MRVGRPIKLLPQPFCDYCGGKAALARSGDHDYPYHRDHGPLWLCARCSAWIGVVPNSRRHVPLGRLANAPLRDGKTRLHAALEPLVAAKVRRDRCNPFEARARACRWLAAEMKLNEKHSNIHLFDLEQCTTAISIIERFVQRRASEKE